MDTSLIPCYEWNVNMVDEYNVLWIKMIGDEWIIHVNEIHQLDEIYLVTLLCWFNLIITLMLVDVGNQMLIIKRHCDNGWQRGNNECSI
jgi:hypothetical protein